MMILHQDVAKAFDTAEEKIGECFTTFNVSLGLRMCPSIHVQ
jgi:hypothetical protein